MLAWMIFVLLGLLGYFIIDAIVEEAGSPVQIKWASCIGWVLVVVLAFAVFIG